MTTDTVAIIQARMGSSRLPGKVLLPLRGQRVIDHVVDQVRHSKHISCVVVATTTHSSDDLLVEHLEQREVAVFRGSERDVLDRFYQCARSVGARTIVRITADCPLIDPSIIDLVIARFMKEKVMYASNVEPPTFPDGLDVEVFSFEALECSWREATLPSEREHVTQFIRKHPERFPRAGIESPIPLAHLRWTLDEPADYTWLSQIVNALPVGLSPVSLSVTLDAVKSLPESLAHNSHIRRNEGLLKSLAEDGTQS
ncbi:MAG: hypothetical protein RL518_2366 [Pseudomonadota bacterium]|jgi:spore coat polysaccharide biosynthesis protein SpsF